MNGSSKKIVALQRAVFAGNRQAAFLNSSRRSLLN